MATTICGFSKYIMIFVSKSSSNNQMKIFILSKYSIPFLILVECCPKIYASRSGISIKVIIFEKGASAIGNTSTNKLINFIGCLTWKSGDLMLIVYSMKASE